MTQKPVLTVTLNPALDISTGINKVEPELKLRCESPSFDPGGGGINVSRAIALMGGSSLPLVALGGAVGMRMERMLRNAGLDPQRIDAPGETRQSIAVLEHETGQQYRFVMPGPVWSETKVEASLERISYLATSGSLVILSGSNPPGVPAEYAALLAARLDGRDVGLIVDTSGPALHAVASGGHDIALLRMDQAEAEELAGIPLTERGDTAAFARSLVASRAARRVIVARGADGNIIAAPEGAWHVEAARIKVVSKVGAGDSFLAGFTLGLARAMSVPDALGLGAAMASAACMTPATELCRREDAEALFAARVVTEV
ncbi:MAG: 1-phosphofructokinase family hexose kinase [Paracoccus sp. (in: a-proteobacteria)]